MTELRVITGTDTFTYYLDGNVQIYPCRCGDIHHNFYDWLHHECYHDTTWKHDQIEGIGYCVECGKTIELVD